MTEFENTGGTGGAPAEAPPTAPEPGTQQLLPPDSTAGMDATTRAEFEAWQRERTGRSVAEIADDVDPMAEWRDRGGVTLYDYNRSPLIMLTDGEMVPEVALAAAGVRDDFGNKIPPAVREANAKRIALSVRQHAAWLDSRTIEERLMRSLDPVIACGPTA